MQYIDETDLWYLDTLDDDIFYTQTYLNVLDKEVVEMLDAPGVKLGHIRKIRHSGFSTVQKMILQHLLLFNLLILGFKNFYSNLYPKL